jgi:WhiB family redox-sensing transcriptional regulator
MNADDDLLASFVRIAKPRPWASQAACRGLDVDLFFPQRGSDGAEAKAVCAKCPVRAECREDGIDEHVGIWGGTSERERRAIRRGDAPKLPPGPRKGGNLRPIRHGTAGGYMAHRRRGGEPCDDCRHAHNQAQRAARAAAAAQRQPKVIEHGTFAGYSAHKRNDTPVCAECLEANRQYHRRRRANKAARDAA